MGQTREQEAVRKNGEFFPIELTVSDVRERDEHLFIATIRDITERKAVEEKIKHLANHDSLTGLPSLRLGKDRLEAALSLAGRHKKEVALLFVDLDGFKAVNDAHGHDAGDKVLIALAERMVKCVRQSDTVARIGGDEFIVVLQEIESRDAALKVAKKVVAAACKPMRHGDLKLTVGASVGLALYPEHAETVADLLRCADEAMYLVKKDGKNGVAVWRP